MVRRVALLAVLALLLAGSALAHGTDHGTTQRKQAIDEKLSRLRSQIEAANRREGLLTEQISAVTSKIRALQGDVSQASSRLSALEGELGVYERRLARLTELLRLQAKKLKLLRQQERVAQRRLNERLVVMYQEDHPTAIEVVLSAESITELVDALDYVGQLGRQDRSIARQVTSAKRRVHVAKVRTQRTRTGVQRASQAIRVRVEAQRAERDRLLASQSALASARSDKREALSSVEASEREFVSEARALEAASARLAATIASAQASASSTPSSAQSGGSTSAVSSSGLIWPVSGPVTSPYGPRWGTTHQGIDIGAGTGTPIRASAAGTVIYSGWMDGYGNLVVIDHGNGLATAYAHNSSNAVGVGGSVGQGAVIAYVGCTGHCFGPHVHFEVRVNGSPVDPLGYL